MTAGVKMMWDMDIGTSRFNDEWPDPSSRAILLADYFTTDFLPITSEHPKALLPLVNTPMIEYTLAFLENAGIKEVFVFCCSDCEKVIHYLEKTGWVGGDPDFIVTPIALNTCPSAGDALRYIYQLHEIHGDFVLVAGNTVSNMDLMQALQEHRENKRKDWKAVMTMVIKESKPCEFTHLTRPGTDELIMAIDQSTKQLLYYEDKVHRSEAFFTLDNSFLAERPPASVHNDKQDFYIDICSPEVLTLFIDNPDYEHLRHHFVKGLYYLWTTAWGKSLLMKFIQVMRAGSITFKAMGRLVEI